METSFGRRTSPTSFLQQIRRPGSVTVNIRTIFSKIISALGSRYRNIRVYFFFSFNFEILTSSPDTLYKNVLRLLQVFLTIAYRVLLLAFRTIRFPIPRLFLHIRSRVPPPAVICLTLSNAFHSTRPGDGFYSNYRHVNRLYSARFRAKNLIEPIRPSPV